MYILTGYRKPFLLQCLQHYRHPDESGLLRKLDAFQLFDATRYVSYGIARDDSEMIDEGLKDLKKLLRSRAATPADF